MINFYFIHPNAEVYLGKINRENISWRSLLALIETIQSRLKKGLIQCFNFML